MKKIALFIFLFLVVLFVFTIFLFRSPSNTSLRQPLPTPTPVSGPSVIFNKINYRGIFPDPIVAKSVEDTLQNPLYASPEGELTAVSFPSDTQGRNNKVYEENNKAEFVVQEITKTNTALSDFISSHPNSQGLTLYDYLTTGTGFNWYVYPGEGIAYLANKDYGYAMRILYFPQMSQDEFLRTGAKVLNLQTTDPDNQNDAPPDN